MNEDYNKLLVYEIILALTFPDDTYATYIAPNAQYAICFSIDGDRYTMTIYGIKDVIEANDGKNLQEMCTHTKKTIETTSLDKFNDAKFAHNKVAISRSHQIIIGEWKTGFKYVDYINVDNKTYIIAIDLSQKYLIYSTYDTIYLRNMDDLTMKPHKILANKIDRLTITNTHLAYIHNGITYLLNNYRRNKLHCWKEKKNIVSPHISNVYLSETEMIIVKESNLISIYNIETGNIKYTMDSEIDYASKRSIIAQQGTSMIISFPLHNKRKGIFSYYVNIAGRWRAKKIYRNGRYSTGLQGKPDSMYGKTVSLALTGNVFVISGNRKAWMFSLL